MTTIEQIRGLKKSEDTEAMILGAFDKEGNAILRISGGVLELSLLVDAMLDQEPDFEQIIHLVVAKRSLKEIENGN